MRLLTFKVVQAEMRPYAELKSAIPECTHRSTCLMPRIQLKRQQIRAWCVVLLLISTYCRGEPPEFKTYRSPNGEYTVTYPGTWVHYPEARSLYILNFPLDHMVREVLLPEHGAMITFATTRSKPKSVEDWTENDMKRHAAVERRNFSVDRGAQSSPLSVTEIISHSVRGRQAFEEIDWYFSIDRHLFNAVLLYHGGDSRSHEYREVLRQVVSSIQLGL